MPRKKTPKTLREASLKQICENFELICYGITWRSSGWRNFVKSGKYLSVTSPLRQLPVHVLCELAQVIIDELGCAPHILHAVIHPQLTGLRLPPVVNTIPLAVKLIVERTNKLSSFELSGCRSMNPLVIAAVLPYLNNLSHLNLEGTNFDDFGLEQLGTWVSGLVTLNIARTNVTDAGIDSVETRLQELSFFILLGNRVNPPCVARFLMSHKCILTLEYESMRDVLTFIVQNQLTNFQTNLRKVILDNCRGDMEKVLEDCIECFPLLEAMSFNNSELSLMMLSPVARLSHLTKLELGNSPSTQLTASLVESVIPILNIIGGQLTHISLENFQFFDVTTIGRYCPKLTSIKLSNILSYCRAENQKLRAFKNLEELHIYNTRWGNITEGMLRQLLGSTKLRCIYLQFVASLSDKLVDDIMSYNSFPHLESISLDQCHRFGPDLMYKLLTNCENLSSLHCWSCGNINEQTRDNLQAYIDKNCLDVNFQWSDFQQEEENNNFLNEEDDLQNLLLPLVGVNILPNVE